MVLDVAVAAAAEIRGGEIAGELAVPAGDDIAGHVQRSPGQASARADAALGSEGVGDRKVTCIQEGSHMKRVPSGSAANVERGTAAGCVYEYAAGGADDKLIGCGVRGSTSTIIPYKTVVVFGLSTKTGGKTMLGRNRI